MADEHEWAWAEWGAHVVLRFRKWAHPGVGPEVSHAVQFQGTRSAGDTDTATHAGTGLFSEGCETLNLLASSSVAVGILR